MPIKKVICSICREEVNKAQTLAIDKEGHRACRHHEGVEEKSKILVEKQKNDLNKAIEKHSIPKLSWQEKYTQNMKDAMILRCWKCEKEAIHAGSYIIRMMIETEKASLNPDNKELNIFEIQNIGAENTIKHFNGKIGVFMVEVNEQQIKSLQYKYRQAAEFGKVIPLCGECCKKLNINIPAGRMDLKESSIFGKMVVDDIIRPIAAQEIAINN